MKKGNKKIREWMMRAKSNLSRAKTGKISPDILYEDLCFDAQQAVEKSLKSLCIAYELVFPTTHNIGFLIELIQKAKVIFPEELLTARLLTDYAVETRYPGDYKPVNESEYQKAVEIAEKMYDWIERRLEK